MPCRWRGGRTFAMSEVDKGKVGKRRREGGPWNRPHSWLAL